MRLIAEPAFVLHARAWRETSMLVEVLTAQYGRVGLIARGVRGAKAHALRAALQPWQHIRFDAVLRGELAQLQLAESLDAAPRLAGEVALAGFYVNELVLRLAPRQDPQPQLYSVYARTREAFGLGESLAWTLRRFERDLLETLGFGFAFDSDGDGMPIDPAARYRLDPEHGPRRSLSDHGHGERSTFATGHALLALAMDRQPEADDLASLRLPMRGVLAHHLGARGLKSWEMLGELARLKTK